MLGRENYLRNKVWNCVLPCALGVGGWGLEVPLPREMIITLADTSWRALGECRNRANLDPYSPLEVCLAACHT